MEATKNHISLKTAKLLKDCKLKSKQYYCVRKVRTTSGKERVYVELNTNRSCLEVDKSMYNEVYPAYTWVEIEGNARLLFGDSEWTTEYDTPEYYYHCCQLLFERLEQRYVEADQYFRENCILIQ